MPTQIPTPDCPDCGRSMILRSGSYGEFFGCSGFPKCRKTINMKAARELASGGSTAGSGRAGGKRKAQEAWKPPAPALKADGSKAGIFGVVRPRTTELPPGSQQQQAIWDIITDKSNPTNICVDASPGTGKTYTCINGILRMDPSLHIGNVAFNRHITAATNFQLTQNGIHNAHAMTFNSLGWAAVRRAYPGVELNKHKLREIADELLDKEKFEEEKFGGKRKYNSRKESPRNEVRTMMIKLMGLSMAFLMNAHSADDLQSIAEQFGLDAGTYNDMVWRLTPQLADISWAKRETEVNYDEQVWLPVVEHLPVDTFDVLMVDECLDGDSPILLADGTTRSIRNLVEEKYNGEVYTRDSDGSTVKRRVIGHHRIPVSRRMLRIVSRRVIRLEDGSRADQNTEYVSHGHRFVICTEDHRLFHATSGKFKYARDLRVGDTLIQESIAPKDKHWVNTRNKEAIRLTDELLHSKIHNCQVECEIVKIDEWLPVQPFVYDLSIEDTHCYFADGILVHNCQDVSRVQLELAMMACPIGRIVVVGDRRQAIMAFRGSDSRAIPRIVERLTESERGCVTLPLTVTRRCPKSHVRLALGIYPGHLEALPDAPEGIIREEVPWRKATLEMKGGDMVMCRVNRFLVPIAYDLIKRGIKAMIRGQEIGENIVSLIHRLKANSIVELISNLNAYRGKESAKFIAMGYRGEGRLASLNEKCDTLYELCEGMEEIDDLITRIEGLFADFDPDGKPNDAVVLGSIHSCKGLESTRVYVLAPELLPHPRATTDVEIEQEYNLLWVGGTRAKFIEGEAASPGELVFVKGPDPKSTGRVPAAYKYVRPEQEKAVAATAVEQTAQLSLDEPYDHKKHTQECRDAWWTQASSCICDPQDESWTIEEITFSMDLITQTVELIEPLLLTAGEEAAPAQSCIEDLSEGMEPEGQPLTEPPPFAPMELEETAA